MLKILMVMPSSKDDSFGCLFGLREKAQLAKAGVTVFDFYPKSRTSPIVLFFEWIRLRKVISNLRPDVVYAQYGTATALLSVCASIAEPVVVVFRGSDLNPIPSGNRVRTFFGHAMSHIAAVFATKIICVSERLRSRLYWGKEKAAIVSGGVDADVFSEISKQNAREALGWPQDKLVVIFYAGMNPKVKRIDLAEAAVEIARKTFPGLGMHVIYSGLTAAQVAMHLNAADLLLFTSDFEGSPTITKEAIACGLPIVSVDVGDVAEQLEGVSGCKIVPRSPDLLAQAMVELLCARQRSNGPKVAYRFTSEFQTRLLLNVLSSAANNTKRGR